MGLSSSQARLLNLTSRMHQIEYKAAKLEAQKLQMANESTRVYEEYLDALESTKVQVKTINQNGSFSYKDITNYKTDFLDQGFALKFNGKVYDGSTKTSYVGSDGTAYSSASHTVESDEAGSGEFAGFSAGAVVAKNENGQYVAVPSGVTVTEVTESLTFDQLCHDAFGAELNAGVLANPFQGSEMNTVITNLINSGEVIIVTGQIGPDGSYSFEPPVGTEHSNETSVAINTDLQEVADESQLRKAEVKYEADMKRIDVKDRKYDSQLAALDTERNAIKQEMETLKTVAKDNVERTFKLFA
jgi:hypothetical protein